MLGLPGANPRHQTAGWACPWLAGGQSVGTLLGHTQSIITSSAECRLLLRGCCMISSCLLREKNVAPGISCIEWIHNYLWIFPLSCSHTFNTVLNPISWEEIIPLVISPSPLENAPRFTSHSNNNKAQHRPAQARFPEWRSLFWLLCMHCLTVSITGFICERSVLKGSTLDHCFERCHLAHIHTRSLHNTWAGASLQVCAKE